MNCSWFIPRIWLAQRRDLLAMMLRNLNPATRNETKLFVEFRDYIA